MIAVLAESLLCMYIDDAALSASAIVEPWRQFVTEIMSPNPRDAYGTSCLVRGAKSKSQNKMTHVPERRRYGKHEHGISCDLVAQFL